MNTIHTRVLEVSIGSVICEENLGHVTGGGEMGTVSFMARVWIVPLTI